MNACVHTYTKPQTSSTRSRGLGWRIHESVEDTKLSTNKQHSLSPRHFDKLGYLLLPHVLGPKYERRQRPRNSKEFRIVRSIVLLLFLQKQNLATAIYLFGLGTLLTRLGLKHMRIRSHHDLAGALVTSLLLGRQWWSTTSPTCLPLSVFTITSDQHRCRIPLLL